MGGASTSQGWPADVIHVNEDGWVLINRGRAHGVAQGLRLLVVGSGTRELRDVFAGNDGEAPVVLRTRRTYELLEVVHADDRCAVAIASRSPAERRPEFYRGPEGELLVWVPLPEGYTWPPIGEDDDQQPEDEAREPSDSDLQEGEAPASADAGDAAGQDVPPGTGDQQDQRWEEALPLNSVSVGDVVIPAVPAASGAAPLSASPRSAAGSAAEPGAAGGGTGDPAAWDRQYDWMNPKSGQ
jgi:hypothetical protein